MPQTTTVRLTVPASPALGPHGARIHWLKSPGDAVRPNDVVAVLGARTELCAPPDISGRIDRLLAGDGALVTNSQPLVRIVPLQSGSWDWLNEHERESGLCEPAAPWAPWGFEESATPFEASLPDRIVMERMDQRTHRTLVVLGGVTAIGLGVAAVCLPLSLVLGDPMVPAIGGFALAVVAGALTCAKRLLRERDD